IEKTIKDINRAIGYGTFPLATINDKKEASIIVISEKTKREARAEFAKADCRLHEEAEGTSCIGYSSKGVILESHIWASKALPASEWRATLLHEVLHALGFQGHSYVALDSVMSFGTPSYKTAARLNALELKTLFLLYRHLKPFDREARVRAAFDKHWGDIEIP
ncbi:MAG: hypothetical protein RIB59_13780, partial [Rhodospirillales bacterium]